MGRNDGFLPQVVEGARAGRGGGGSGRGAGEGEEGVLGGLDADDRRLAREEGREFPRLDVEGARVVGDEGVGAAGLVRLARREARLLADVAARVVLVRHLAEPRVGRVARAHATERRVACVETKMFRIRSTWSIWNEFGESDHPDLRRSSKQRGSLGLKERAEKTSF